MGRDADGRSDRAAPLDGGQDGQRWPGARDGGVWTKEKLVYLAKYSAAFMKAMGPKRKLGLWDRLVYIDPLCGPGIDVDRSTGEEFRGSPLIALETAPAFDRIFLGDLSKANVEALEKRVPNGNAARVSLKVEDCHERARQAVQEMRRRDLGLAFVDPEGFEVTFELFRTLAERRIDIVFLFPSGIGIGRNFAKFVQSQRCAMDDLWGSRDWRDTAVAKRYATTTLVSICPMTASISPGLRRSASVWPRSGTRTTTLPTR